ncbi:OpgC family protein [Zavarzinia sp. CC-PAN008]|uniref:OpgC family protein n=1 Tax=Zavarzinia sp. CC-PAN008 TaxID=3243332 RepID=UPI003F7499B3
MSLSSAGLTGTGVPGSGTPRITIFDGMRGYFLLLMTLTHMVFAGGAMVVRVHHGELGFVEDAQGFIFLSGLVIGLTYAKAMRRHGIAAVRTKARKRVAKLYRMILLTLAVLMAAAFLLPDARTFWSGHLGVMLTRPVEGSILAALLLYQPAFLDILPQYMIYLLIAPWLVHLVAEGHAVRVLIGSVLMWLAAQFGLHLDLANWAEAAIRAQVPDSGLRSYFNPMGWQLLFCTGLVAGAGMATGRLDPRPLLAARHANWAKLALGMVLVFFAFRLAYTFAITDNALFGRFWPLFNRHDLSLVYVLNFAATGYLVAWTIANFDQVTNPVVRRAGQALHWLFTRKPLVFLGQHSLQVYAWHVLVAYGVVAIDAYFKPFSEVQKAVIAVVALASLWIPAWWDAGNGFRRFLPQRDALPAAPSPSTGTR